MGRAGDLLLEERLFPILPHSASARVSDVVASAAHPIELRNPLIPADSLSGSRQIAFRQFMQPTHPRDTLNLSCSSLHSLPCSTPTRRGSQHEFDSISRQIDLATTIHDARERRNHRTDSYGHSVPPRHRIRDFPIQRNRPFLLKIRDSLEACDLVDLQVIFDRPGTTADLLACSSPPALGPR